jgi:probable rRNA maturation factor
MEFCINNIQKKIGLDIRFIKKVFATLNKNLTGKLKNHELVITFVDDTYIRRLNKRFFGRDTFTDVIAFPFEEHVGPAARGHKPSKVILGDVVVSVTRARVQSKKFKHSFNEELALLVIHGTLHLLGYDDIKAKDAVMMRKKEQEILQTLSRET